MNAGQDWKDQLKELHEHSYSWSLFCCNRDREMAKDVLQTVYLKVYEGRARFHQQSTLKSWLFSVIRHTATDMLRMKSHAHSPLEEHHHQVADTTRPDDFERQSTFKKILESLSGQQRAVLTLAFYHDLSLEEVAETLGISIGSVRTHYERGKENFRKIFEEQEEQQVP